LVFFLHVASIIQHNASLPVTEVSEPDKLGLLTNGSRGIWQNYPRKTVGSTSVRMVVIICVICTRQAAFLFCCHANNNVITLAHNYRSWRSWIWFRTGGVPYCSVGGGGFSSVQ